VIFFASSDALLFRAASISATVWTVCARCSRWTNTVPASFAGQGEAIRAILDSQFKFGADASLAIATIGAGGVAVQNISTITGIGQNAGGATNLLNDLSGSLTNAFQTNNSPGGANPVFIPGQTRYRTWQQREYSWFFKDDFKVSRRLTLNLGLRYEWYGVPVERQGRMLAPVGGGGAVFGISGTDFGADNIYANRQFAGGDVNTSLIMTEKGVTVTLNHDTQLPRPYSDSGDTKIPLMVQRLQGTEGMFFGSMEKIYIDGRSPLHKWEDTASYYEQYEHFLWKELGAAAKSSSHGGEDFVEMVVPELQRRGLFRTEYEGRTLRENLGLRPIVNRYSRHHRAAE
jgi:hypothetical protein